MNILSTSRGRMCAIKRLQKLENSSKKERKTFTCLVVKIPDKYPLELGVISPPQHCIHDQKCDLNKYFLNELMFLAKVPLSKQQEVIIQIMECFTYLSLYYEISGQKLKLTILWEYFFSQNSHWMKFFFLHLLLKGCGFPKRLCHQVQLTCLANFCSLFQPVVHLLSSSEAPCLVDVVFLTMFMSHWTRISLWSGIVYLACCCIQYPHNSWCVLCIQYVFG